MRTLNTESLELFGVPFKRLNCRQRMDIYSSNNLSSDIIDELETIFTGSDTGNYW
jgi:hypothetical protein